MLFQREIEKSKSVSSLIESYTRASARIFANRLYFISCSPQINPDDWYFSISSGQCLRDIRLVPSYDLANDCGA